MSEENVQIIREMWEEGVKGDPTAVPTSFMDPDVVYEDQFIPDHAGETYRGHDGMQRAWDQVLDAFEEGDFDNEILWTRDAGDAVVSCHHVRARGKGSGVAVEFDYAYVWRLRAGKIIRCTSFRSSAEALEAAGLGE
jgi:ketosteroid isomerase-like protein